MKRFNIKVENSSMYWADFEGDLCVYYQFRWVNENTFFENKNIFIEKYISLAKKYRIAFPINDFDYDSELDTFYPLYQKEDGFYYPTSLFVSPKDNLPRSIISIDPLITLENSTTKFSSHGSIPIRIELLKQENERKVLCYLDNDIFNSWIDNKKTKRDPEIGGKDCWVDNSELAYLNTPRLNSFLRDLKKLCFEYGANDFEFEDLGLNDFCKDGVMFNGEIVYYEDIVDLLEPHQRIVS